MIASMVVYTTRVRIKAGSKSGEASPLRWFQVQARARSLYLNPVMSDINFSIYLNLSVFSAALYISLCSK